MVPGFEVEVGVRMGIPVSGLMLEEESLTRLIMLKCLSDAPEVHDLAGVEIVCVRPDIAVKYGPAMHINRSKQHEIGPLAMLNQSS